MSLLGAPIIQKRGDRLIDRIGDNDAFGQLRVGESFLGDMTKKRDQRIPKPLDIDQDYWLPMQAKMLPGKDFKKFIERAVAPR